MAQVVYDAPFKEVKKEKNWFQKTGSKVGKWCSDHKEILIPLTPVLVGAGIDIAKMYMRRNNNIEERRLKENFVYDASCRHYYELNRKPSAQQWIEIDKRVKGGELLGQILDEMNLVK